MTFRLNNPALKKEIIRTLALSLLMLFTVACSRSHKQDDIGKVFADGHLKSEVQYAKGFDIYKSKGITKIVVYTSPDKKGKQQTFYIVDKKLKGQFPRNSGLFYGVPGNAAVFSATQLTAFEKLGIQDKVTGVSEAAYIKSPYFRKRLAEGKVSELAGSGSFFTEKAITVHPSVIFYTPYSVNDLHTMEITGIPLVPFNDYRETTPLGRAEWIKFTAAFFNRSSLADSIFSDIVAKYEQYKSLTKDLKERPTVFTDKYFNGQWFVAGGKSYTAAFFADAGADYIWKDDIHTASFPLEYEVVYQKAHDAGYWRIILSYGEKPSYRVLAQENELYRHFRAFRERHVIYCNPQETAYFENSPLEPQIVLADLIRIFHPELLPEYKPKYFRLMKDE